MRAITWTTSPDGTAAPADALRVPRAWPSEAVQRFRALFDEVDTPALVLALDARILDANAACERVTGHRRHALAGRTAEALLARSDGHRRHWESLVAGRRHRYELPCGLLCADGRVLPVHLVTTLVRDGEGRPVHAVCCASTTVVPLHAPPARPLTHGEGLVLVHLAAGRTIQEIADALHLSRRGVDYRLAQLRRKLRADGSDGVGATAAALVARAYRLGVLDASAWPPRLRAGAP